MEPDETLNRQHDQLTVDEWLAIRTKEAGRIDPATAEVFWNWGNVVDPYGVCPHCDECIGRLYWARSPGSDVWVYFDDLPQTTFDELWDRIKKGLTRFPEIDLNVDVRLLALKIVRDLQRRRL